MEPNLRPLTLGEILDRTAQLYRTNFLLFAGISAVLAGVVLVINLISIGLVEALHLGQFAALENLWIQLLGWVSFLLMLVVGQVATAANNRAVAWLCLGEPASISNAYRSVLSRFGRYLWIGAAKLFIAWTPVILLYGAFQASYIYFMRTGVLPRPGEIPQPHAGDTSGTLMFAMVSLGFFVLIWPALTYSVFMALRYALALPASVVENLSARQALRRSIELTKGARGRIFVLWILVGVIAFMAGAITQTFFVAYSMKHHYVIPLGIRILQQVIAFCTNTLVGPVLATGTCLFYFDQRVRKEGYDIEWMMQAAGLVPPVGVVQPAEPAHAALPEVADVAVAPAALDEQAGESCMIETLHPSTLGEILDRTTNLYRSRFLVFFGIASVPAGVLLGFGGLLVLLSSLTGTAQPGAAIGLVIGIVLLALVGFPATLAASGLSAAALCHAASALMMGEPISITSAYKAVWKRGWSYVGLYVLEGLIIAAAPLVVWSVLLAFIGVAAVAGKAGPGSDVLVGSASALLFLGVVVYAVWMLLQLCLAFPAAVVEQMPVGPALKRAWTLSAGTRWRMLVLFVLGVALGWVATLLLIVPLVIAISLMPGMNSPQHTQMVGTVMMIGFYGASFAVQALTRPVYGIALVLFYYDQRVRKEGFDIELLMRQAGMVQEPAPQPTIPWTQMPSVVHVPGAEAPAEGSATAQNGTDEAVSDSTAGGGA